MNNKLNAGSAASKASNRIWSAYNTVWLYSLSIDAYIAAWIMDRFGGGHSSGQEAKTPNK